MSDEQLPEQSSSEQLTPEQGADTTPAQSPAVIHNAEVLPSVPAAPVFQQAGLVPTPAPAPMTPQPMKRPPVGYQPAEEGWWYATDGLWYPPESLPQTSPQPAPTPQINNPAAGSQNVVVQVVQPQYQQQATFVTGPQKSKVAAGLLGIFLGVFGVHRFYLGFSGVGIVMLLLTVLSFGLLSPFVALWGFIEGVVLLTGGMNRDSHGRPLI